MYAYNIKRRCSRYELWSNNGDLTDNSHLGPLFSTDSTTVLKGNRGMRQAAKGRRGRKYEQVFTSTPHV